MHRTTLLHAGTSGLNVPIPRTDYPAAYQGKSRLAYYSSVLNSLEVNSTFYRNPRMATLQKWLSEVPSGFSFTFKIPKTISHVKGLAFAEAELLSFLSLVNDIPVKGCLLLQLPPSSTVANYAALDSLLRTISANANGWRIAVEFRDASWYTDNTFRLMNRYATAVVMHDFKKGGFFDTGLEQPFYYFRFHGPESNYRGTYTDLELEDFAAQTRICLQQGKPVYCYFNNTMGAAFENGKHILSLVGSR